MGGSAPTPDQTSGNFGADARSTSVSATSSHLACLFGGLSGGCARRRRPLAPPPRRCDRADPRGRPPPAVTTPLHPPPPRRLRRHLGDDAACGCAPRRLTHGRCCHQLPSRPPPSAPMRFSHIVVSRHRRHHPRSPSPPRPHRTSAAAADCGTAPAFRSRHPVALDTTTTCHHRPPRPPATPTPSDQPPRLGHTLRVATAAIPCLLPHLAILDVLSPPSAVTDVNVGKLVVGEGRALHTVRAAAQECRVLSTPAFSWCDPDVRCSAVGSAPCSRFVATTTAVPLPPPLRVAFTTETPLRQQPPALALCFARRGAHHSARNRRLRVCPIVIPTAARRRVVHVHGCA
jgi:hypothetical protein